MKVFTKKTIHAGRLLLAALLCLVSIGMWGETTVVFSENFSALTQGSNTTTNGSSTRWTGNVNFPQAGLKDAYPADGAVKLGGGSAPGTLTTKAIDLSANDGNFTIKFDVKGWTTVEGKLNVSLDGKLLESVTYTAKMADAFETVTINATGGTAISTIVFATSAKRAFLDNIEISQPAPTTVSAPVFTPPTGQTFTDKLNVKLSSSTEGANIYYTTDGETVPTAASTLYTDAGIDLTATTTIKAIAIAPEGTLEPSDVVEATYTKVEPLAGFDALRNAIVEDNITSSSNAKEYTVKFTDAVVTKVSGNIAFLQEGENGFYYYKSGHGYNEGDVLNGIVTVKGFMYNGWPEMTSIEGETVTKGGTYAPVEVTLAELVADYDKYESRLVKVVAAEITEGFTKQNGEITQGGTTMTLRAANSSITATKGSTVDIIGVLGKFNTDIQLNVYLQDDITKNAAYKTFAFSATEATATLPEDVEGLPVLNNEYTDAEGTVAYSSSDENVAMIDEATGEVVLMSAGKTTIKAEIKISETLTRQTSYELTVVKAKAALEFEQPVYTVNFNEIVTLKAVCTPANAGTITYSTDEEKNIAVDEESGDVHAGDVAGNYTVTATLVSDNYEATATCTVRVKDPNAKDPEVIYYEDFGTTGNKGTVNAYNGYTSSLITPTSADWKISDGKTETSNYDGASGDCNAYVGSQDKEMLFAFDDKVKNYTDINLSFGYVTGTKSGNESALALYVSKDGGTTWSDNLITAESTGGSTWATFSSDVTDFKDNLVLKFKNIGSNNTVRIDDVKLVGVPTSSTPSTVPVTVSSVGYATFCSDKSLDFTDSKIEAYTATLDEADPENIKVNFARTMTVAAGEGVLLHAEGGATENVPAIANADKTEGNVLVGELNGIESQPSTDGSFNYYILNNGARGLGFYAANDKAIGAGKAYLKIAVAQAAKLSFVGLDGVVNGIGEIGAGAAADNTYHSLSGMRTNRPAKGLYIKNGKKVIVK